MKDHLSWETKMKSPKSVAILYGFQWITTEEINNSPRLIILNSQLFFHIDPN